MKRTLLLAGLLCTGHAQAAPVQLKIGSEPGGKAAAEWLARKFDRNGKSETKVEAMADRDAGYGPLMKGKLQALHLVGELEDNDRSAYGITAVRYARMPVAIVVHASVGKLELTSAQVCELFSGARKNWMEVSGPNLPVAVQGRVDSLSLQALKKHVPCFANLEFGPETNFNTSDSDMLDSLKKEAGAIGFAALPDVLTHRLTAVLVDGESPTSRSYKPAIPLVLVLPPEPTITAKQLVAMSKEKSVLAELADIGLLAAD